MLFVESWMKGLQATIRSDSPRGVENWADIAPNTIREKNREDLRSTLELAYGIPGCARTDEAIEVLYQNFKQYHLKSKESRSSTSAKLEAERLEGQLLTMLSGKRNFAKVSDKEKKLVQNSLDYFAQILNRKS